MEEPQMDADAHGWGAGGRLQMSAVFCLLLNAALRAQAPLLDLHFERDEGMRLMNGAKIIQSASGGVLQCARSIQSAEIDFSKKLHDVSAATIGGWFFPWR